MKSLNPKYLVTLFVAAIAVAFAGSAAARGDHDGHHHVAWHGDRMNLTWTVDGATDVYTVDTPMNPPLRFVKKMFMAKTGMGVHESDDFVVEKKVVTTTTAAPGPSVPLPPGALPSGRDTGTTATTTTSVSYVLLDDTKSLADQGIVEGDTLRIREVPEDESTETHHGHHHGWGRHHHHHHHHR